MSMTDPISDLLTRVRNAQMAAHETVQIPFSKIKHSIVQILAEEGYVEGHTITESSPSNIISIRLKYDSSRQPAMQVIRRVSKPGRRVYVPRDRIPKVLGGLGINILSTSKGLVTGKNARKQGVGGEILCEIY